MRAVRRHCNYICLGQSAYQLHLSSKAMNYDAPLKNPYRRGTQKWFLLELYREHNYRVRASQTHEKITIGERSTFLQSPTKVESDLRKDGFVFDKPKKVGNSKDLLHIIVTDPHNPRHTSEAFKMQPAATAGDLKKDAEEKKPEMPAFGEDYCEEHKRRFPFGGKCWDCTRRKLTEGATA